MTLKILYNLLSVSLTYRIFENVEDVKGVSVSMYTVQSTTICSDITSSCCPSLGKTDALKDSERESVRRLFWDELFVYQERHMW